ncbi:MAG: cation:proton antiporter [Rickettsiales bacterium]|nr:MAG: cation:proton antiporter [Rickettsiales bacterium]
MLNICLVIILTFSSIVICGALWQKDVFTKLLFLNSGTSLAALFICFLGSFEVNSSYIDIALIYFLLSIVATSAYMKYFLQKHKGNKNAPS